MIWNHYSGLRGTGFDWNLMIGRALQWVPMNFFPKIPEIDLRRFSLQFSFGVVVAIHEKLEKFQNIWIGDLSENLQYLEKRFQCDNAVYKNKCRNNEAFSRYASYHWVFGLRRDICNIPNGYPWVSIFKWVTHRRPMQHSDDWQTIPIFWGCMFCEIIFSHFFNLKTLILTTSWAGLACFASTQNKNPTLFSLWMLLSYREVRQRTVVGFI